MHYPIYLRTIEYGPYTTEIYMPDEAEVRTIYEREKKADPRINFPFWTRLWPSAIALSIFIRENEGLVAGKKVLELGAGLALPSLIAAPKALSVTSSDHSDDAVETMASSFSHHSLRNAHSVMIDVMNIPEHLQADIILLSDLNYDPRLFPDLIKLLERFLANGSTILLGTPQRIMGVSFIEALLPKMKAHHLFEIKEQKEIANISVFEFGN